MLWKIAFRNILRHKRRTIFSSLTIMFGMMFCIFMDSLLTGMDRAGIDNMIDHSTASLKIRTAAYIEDQKALPLKYGISNSEEIKKVLSGYERVKGIAPRTAFLGQLSMYTEIMPVAGQVIDPAADTTVFRTGEYIEGEYFSSDNRREIIIGKNLAEDFKLAAGDRVTLYALTRYDSHNADDFRVVGLFNSPDPSINRSAVYITFDAANEFLDLEGLVTELNVGLHRRTNLSDMQKNAGLIATGLQGRFSDLQIQTFMELAADFLEIAKTKRAFGYIFLVVIMLIASIGIFNTVLMSVYERIREVGVLRAFGFTPRELTGLFILEGFITGIFGAILGITAGVVVNTILVTYGYPLDQFGDMGDFPVWGTIYGEWNLTTYIIISIFCVLTATLAGLIPARKAGKMEITQTLRFV